MAEENVTKNNDAEESEIDLLELASTLWANRRKVIKWCIWGGVIALVIAFSIPKEYTAETKLAPEWNEKKGGSGNLSALASMAGINLSNSNTVDAVYPLLYPDIISSVPFMTSLFDVEVPLADEDERKMPLQQYVTEELRQPWWVYVLSLPFKLIGLLLPNEEEDADHQLDNFRLTKEETDMVEFLRGTIVTDVDQMNSVVTISVTTQDPLVSATLADTVISRLKEYITEYRTNKARQDLDYVTALNKEAKQNYYAAQQRYADYLDRHQGLAFRSAEVTRERLSQEVSLAYSLYNSTSQQVQQAQAKVQEITPVVAVLQPPTVPVKASAPRKFRILIAFVFLAFVACATNILFIKPFLDKNKSKFKDDKSSETVISGSSSEDE